MPGVWREAWAGGRQLGVGGWDRKWGPGGGVWVSHRLGRGLYLVGTADSQGRELRTHMFFATNSYMYIHMHLHMRHACVSMDGGDWGLGTFKSKPPPPLQGYLLIPHFVGFGLSPILPLPPIPVVSVDFCASVSLACSPLMSV